MVVIGPLIPLQMLHLLVDRVVAQPVSQLELEQGGLALVGKDLRVAIQLLLVPAVLRVAAEVREQ